MFEQETKRWSGGLLLLALMVMCSGVGRGQENKKGASTEKPAVTLSFLPPPLEKATYSLGIYEAKRGKLVRHLLEFAPESAFNASLNGFIIGWDGKDDNGKAVSPGRYAARGYAVGMLKVEGTAMQGNDWASEDESLRIKHVEYVAFLAADDGLAVLATTAQGEGTLFRVSCKGEMLWHKAVADFHPEAHPWLDVKGDNIFFMPRLGKEHTDDAVMSAGTYRISDGMEESERPTNGLSFTIGTPAPSPGFTPAPEPPTVSTENALAAPAPETGAPLDAAAVVALVKAIPAELGSKGRDRTKWTAAGQAGLIQIASDGSVLRNLDVKPGDPFPFQVSASTKEDRLYLVESRPGWQRVRGLVWTDAKEENGHPISTWQTFFERNIRSLDASSDPEGKAAKSSPAVEINLIENPLSPGKSPKMKLSGAYDEKGSYLVAADGLRLRRISERVHLQAAKLTRRKNGDGLMFMQDDGAAWDEFSIEGARNIMEFDAGEFDMTAGGEKAHTEKPVEPPDL